VVHQPKMTRWPGVFFYVDYSQLSLSLDMVIRARLRGYSRLQSREAHQELLADTLLCCIYYMLMLLLLLLQAARPCTRSSSGCSGEHAQ
jgi:hypothetical protein